MNIKITRYKLEGEILKGRLVIDSLQRILYTSESLWNDNAEEESCIPDGRYVVKKHIYPNYGLCYKISNIEDREDVYIHNGNTDDEIMGNIVLREGEGDKPSRDFANSGRKALDIMLNELDSEFNLEIVNEY